MSSVTKNAVFARFVAFHIRLKKIKGENIMAVSFLNSFLSYLVVLAVIAVVGAVAITLGITLRKKKNAAEEKKQTEE